MASLSRPFTDKQEMVLQYVLAGTEDDYICNRFRTAPPSSAGSHPLFIAELNRRQHELWNDVAGELRLAASQAVHAIRSQLGVINNDTVRLRAARTLIQLVNAHRAAAASSANPIHLQDILDELLHRQQPTAAASTFTDTQRHSLLTQLLKEDASAEAQEDAEAEARRQARKNRQSVATNHPLVRTAPT